MNCRCLRALSKGAGGEFEGRYERQVCSPKAEPTMRDRQFCCHKITDGVVECVSLEPDTDLDTAAAWARVKNDPVRAVALISLVLPQPGRDLSGHHADEDLAHQTHASHCRGHDQAISRGSGSLVRRRDR